MSVTKHKLFQIKIGGAHDIALTKSIDKELNKFLSDPNNVYVNHSITYASDDKVQYDQINTVSKYVIVSLIYKDINDTPLNLRSTSKKVKSIVQKEVVSGEEILEPKIEGEF